MPVLSRNVKRALAIGTATVAVSGVSYGFGANSFLRPTETRQNIPAGSANPMIANGTSKGGMVALYTSSGTGPAGSNSAAPSGTVERYINPGQFPGAELPAGVTITEAQGWNALDRIGANLDSVGLDFDDVITMRVFLSAPPGADVADFAGFNRAYRQFFANTNLQNGEVILQPVGSAAPTTPEVVNPARPSRSLLEVANLPVAGWLVEIEVDAPLGR